MALGLAPDCVPQTLLLQRAKAVAEELHDRRPLALMLANEGIRAFLEKRWPVFTGY